MAGSLHKSYVNEVNLSGKTYPKMLLASLTFYTILKEFRSFNAESLGSIDQRAAKLPAIKPQCLIFHLNVTALSVKNNQI